MRRAVGASHAASVEHSCRTMLPVAYLFHATSPASKSGVKSKSFLKPNATAASGSTSRRSRTAVAPCAATTRQDADSKRQLLDAFWEARGVFDVDQRARLVEAASELPQQGSTPLSSSQPLPGVPSTWSPEKDAPEEVLEVSRRLVQLQALLGGNGSGSTDQGSKGGGGGGSAGSSSGRSVAAGADVTWMVVREPGLLTADYADVMRRLLEMKILAAGSGIDVVAVVERQPSLLLTDSFDLGVRKQAAAAAAAAGAPAEGSSDGRSAVGQLPGSNADADDTSPGGGGIAGGFQSVSGAWKFGLAADGAVEWSNRYRQLVRYKAVHGDPHCGFRSGEDADLVRWSGKQRSDLKRGELEEGRRVLLEALGFEFKEDEAEFQRWFAQLADYQQKEGHCSPSPLSTGNDLYLIHWCSIQRIALRSHVLSEARTQQLTDLGFDWTGADPLS